MPKKDVSLDDLNHLWDGYAQIYDGLMLIPLFQDMKKNSLHAVLPNVGGTLHIGGCGPGYYIKELLDITKSDRIIATDISDEMIRRAEDKVSLFDEDEKKKVAFLRLDLLTDWPEESFDTQTFFAFHYLPHEGWKKIITKAYETMNAGGYLYYSSFIKGLDVSKITKEHIKEQLVPLPPKKFVGLIYSLIKAVSYNKKFARLIEKGDVVLPSKEELVEFCKELGFKNVELAGTIVYGAGVIIRAQKP